MTANQKPLSARREQRIRDLPKQINHHAWSTALDARDAIRDLLGELDRLRAEAAKPKPMASERLARLRRDNEPLGDHQTSLTADEVGELLAEVNRAQAEELREQAITVTQAMVDRAWETFGYERAPYMARISNFTRAQIDNGELIAADAEATAMNDDLMRRTIAAALEVAPWHGIPHGGDHQLSRDLDAAEELQRLRRQLGNAKIEWASDAPRFFVTMPFFTKDDVLTIVQAVRGAGGTAQVKARLVGDWYDAEGNEHG